MIACVNCRWYSPGSARLATKEGTCRSHAPMQLTEDPPPPTEESDEDGNTVMTYINTTTYTGWPDVMASDWCGEFAAQ